MFLLGLFVLVFIDDNFQFLRQGTCHIFLEVLESLDPGRDPNHLISLGWDKISENVIKFFDDSWILLVLNIKALVVHDLSFEGLRELDLQLVTDV